MFSVNVRKNMMEKKDTTSIGEELELDVLG